MSKSTITNIISRCSDYAHRKLFGSRAGKRTDVFAKNISLSFSGGMITFVILFIVSIIAARVLGPEEYGRYAVVFSIAQILSLFFVLELDVSALYFLSRKSSKRREFTASISIMFFINIVIFIFLAVSIYQLFMPINISGTVFVGAIILALSFALKRMTDAFLRIEKKFKMQAVFKIAEAITVVSVLLVLFFLVEHRDYFSYILALVLGGGVFIVLGGSVVRGALAVQGATVKSVNTVFGYNVFGIIGATVNGIIKNMDKIIVVALLGVSVGGVYAVYFTASVTIGARITQLFVNVFFPTVRSSKTNVSSVFKKINIVVLKTFVPAVIVASGGVAFIIFLYGSQYQFVWLWVLLAGGYIVVHFFASLYGWLLSSMSRDGYKKHNISFVYGAIVYYGFLGVIFASGFFGITALLVALIIFRAVGGFVSFRALQKIL